MIRPVYYPKYYAYSLITMVTLILVFEPANSSERVKSSGKTTLIARPDGVVEVSKPESNYIIARRPATPVSLPTANLSLAPSRERVDPAKQLISPSGPVKSTSCLIDFADFDAIGNLPDFAEDTFAYSYWWHQSCDPINYAVVRPIGDNHFHLIYEDPHIKPCPGGLKDWGVVLDDGICQDFDPREENRSLAPHTGAVTTHFYIYNGSNRQPFTLDSIRIENTEAIKLCYKPVQNDDGPWETSEPSGTTSSGIWFCWQNLPTGHWNLSEWANYITEVKITSSSGYSNYQIDDIRVSNF